MQCGVEISAHADTRASRIGATVLILLDQSRLQAGLLISRPAPLQHTRDISAARQMRCLLA